MWQCLWQVTIMLSGLFLQHLLACLRFRWFLFTRSLCGEISFDDFYLCMHIVKTDDKCTLIIFRWENLILILFEKSKPRISANPGESRSVNPDSHKPLACSWHSPTSGGTLVRAASAHYFVLKIYLNVLFFCERWKRDSSVPPSVGECHEHTL